MSDTLSGRNQIDPREDCAGEQFKYEIVHPSGGNDDICDNVDSDMVQEAKALAERRGLKIKEDEELHSLALSGGTVIGAAWNLFDGENYEFTVVVDKEYESKGLGKRLAALVVEARSHHVDTHEDSLMLVYVASNQMNNILRQQGFVVTRVLNATSAVMGLRGECTCVFDID